MTGQDVAFLLIGMLTGVGIGIAIAGLLRRGSSPHGDVRITVAPNAIPRRSATLSSEARPSPSDQPARGGPADPWPGLVADAPAPSRARTPVRAALSPSSMPFVFATAGAGPTRLVAVPMGDPGGGPTPDTSMATAGAARAATAAVLDRPATVRGRAAATALEPRPDRAEAVGDGGPGDPPAPTAPEQGAATSSAPPAPAFTPSGPCAELRTVADERCEVATRARAEAERAQDTLRAAQRSYDDHQARAEEAARAADPRSIRDAKDRAQERFRAARGGAPDAAAVDAAARDWLLEINRINQEARSAAASAARDQETVRQLASSLDRLTVEADAARIAAESADEACLAARQAAADCEEAQQAEPAALPAMPSGAPSGLWLDDPPLGGDEAPSALRVGTAPTIFRLLQGDRVSMIAVIDRLAGDDPDQRRAWQLAMSNLVDAILATAIDGAALEFPEEHWFWGPFTLGQSRDIVAALGSLGYHFDGLGSWQDGRVPSQRDLSLALGYAGLDPMRMRRWPNEAEMAELFGEVRVAAPEYLAVAAGDLTLGELVTMLGPRAEPLADVWNAWGRIRPLLLEER